MGSQALKVAPEGINISDKKRDDKRKAFLIRSSEKTRGGGGGSEEIMQDVEAAVLPQARRAGSW